MSNKENFIAVWIVTILLTFVKAVAFWIFWNWLIPYMFGLPEISLWQSIGGWYLWAVVTLKFSVKNE